MTSRYITRCYHGDHVTHLCTQLEVSHGYGHLGTSNDEDDKDKVEKTKQIIKLILPNSLKREKEKK